MPNWQTIWAAVAAIAAVAALVSAAFNSHLMLRLRTELLEMRQNVLDKVGEDYTPRLEHAAEVKGIVARLELVERRR